MNLQVLKSLGFWVTAVTTVIGLLMTSGIVLTGSSVDHVVGWILALVGAISGHSVAAAAPAAPAAAA